MPNVDPWSVASATPVSGVASEAVSRAPGAPPADSGGASAGSSSPIRIATPLPASGSSGSTPLARASGLEGTNRSPSPNSSVHGEVSESLDEPGRKESANENAVLAIFALEITSNFV